MVTLCDKYKKLDFICDTCINDKQDVYICLKSETEFLSSLLRLGFDETGNKNLLGYKPSELIDWYLYAKRSFTSWPSEDHFGWGLKLLDELGKILFGITQVTAKRPDGDPISKGSPHEAGKLLLLQPQEQELVKAFLGKDSSEKEDQLRIISEVNSDYEKKISEVMKLCSEAEKGLNNGTEINKWRQNYENSLECRIAYTEIQEIRTFHWGECGTDVLLILRKLLPDENKENREELVLWRSARLKFACAYLHGVARFALSKKETIAGEFGYWVDDAPSKADVTKKSNLSNHESKGLDSPSIPQTYGYVPLPRDSEVMLSCELAASFAQEYWKTLDLPEKNALFNVLFMCKEDAGWFWALTNSQLQYFQNNLGDKYSSIRKALNQFRFKQAGIINHLEHTECLIEEVYDFTKEKFICTTVGYHLEDSREVATEFALFETSLPRVRTGSYFYFRITPHDKDKETGAKFLPEGALVAIFRFDRELRIAERLKYMAVVRQLVERWRAKVDSLATVTNVVRKLSQPFQEKTARAAIMSRNLSHNVGSHALANSRFFEVVGVLNEQSSAPGDTQRSECLKITRTDGSNTCVQKGETWRTRSRLGALNSYLQGRMDFIARALGESSSQPEPMFFINDLIKGFLSQSVLLNTLLSDNGYTAPDLDFCVTVKRIGRDSSTACFTGKTGDNEIRHVEFEQSGNIEDVLVAIPGGMVGRHAFFAFLENYIRNAAKYGVRAKGRGGEQRFVVNLYLEECLEKKGAYRLDELHNNHARTACYTLTLTDNLSVDADGSIAQKIRGHLDENIIDDQGEARTEGHGIQEMKVCAQFMAGGARDALVFPIDKDTNGDSPLGKDYELYLKQQGVKPLEEKSSLVCFNKFKDEINCLAYGLLLQQPRLLGIVTLGSNQGENILIATHEPTVAFYRDIETLAKNPAYFGLVLLADTSSVEEILEKEISLRHTALPFRLMLVIQDENKVSAVQRIVDEWQKSQADLWWKPKKENDEIKPFPLPHRRVHTIAYQQMFESFKESCNRNASDWQKIICNIYDAWLYAYKGHELPDGHEQWHLGVGFQRDMGSVLDNKWNLEDNNDEINLGFRDRKHLRLHLFTLENDGSTRNHVADNGNQDQESLLQVCSEKRALLALDNHKAVLQEIDEAFLKGSIASYHPFSGGEQMMLFQLLDSPPRDPFVRTFLIFSIAEALLTRVVVVDERLADATVEKGDIFASKMESLQKARIYPLYSVQSEERLSTGVVKPIYHPLSSTVWDALKKAKSTEVIPAYQVEGLHVSPIRHKHSRDRQEQKVRLQDHLVKLSFNGQIAFAEITEEGVRLHEMTSEGEYPDFIVIHEGVTDILDAAKGWCVGAHEELYELCPSIIRTSGRGSISRHLGGQLPFMEFSELSDSTYRQMNKVTLAKGLLSLRGGK